MDAELRDKIEEVAKTTLNGLNNNCYIHIDENTEDAYKDGFRDGAEFGYKEAIARAKEWLKENSNKYASYMGISYKLIRDFEADMNKLLEEEK